MANPYEPLSEDEKLQRDSDKKAIADSIRSVVVTASECLDDPKFKKYREEYEKLRKEVYEKLNSPIDQDPVNDAYYLRSCINTILILGRLLERVVADSKRSVPDVGNV